VDEEGKRVECVLPNNELGDACRRLITCCQWLPGCATVASNSIFVGLLVKVRLGRKLEIRFFTNNQYEVIFEPIINVIFFPLLEF